MGVRSVITDARASSQAVRGSLSITKTRNRESDGREMETGMNRMNGIGVVSVQSSGSNRTVSAE
jgi:hypothetical protein